MVLVLTAHVHQSLACGHDNICKMLLATKPEQLKLMGMSWCAFIWSETNVLDKNLDTKVITIHPVGDMNIQKYCRFFTKTAHDNFIVALTKIYLLESMTAQKFISIHYI